MSPVKNEEHMKASSMGVIFIDADHPNLSLDQARAMLPKQFVICTVSRLGTTIQMRSSVYSSYIH